jgi:hypothetical protein
MVRLSFSCRSGLESVDADVLFQASRMGRGAPMDDFEEPVTGAREGLKVMEVGGVARWCKEEPDKLSIMAKHSKRETVEVEEVRGANSGNKISEESVEGEPGGETDARGRGGFQGEPLHDCPR